MSVPGIPPGGADPRQTAASLSAALQGKLNCTGSVTLTQSATSTTLTDPRIGGDSVILFMPTTANAAGALSGLYVSARAKGSATLTHASTAAADKTFGYAVIG